MPLRCCALCGRAFNRRSPEIEAQLVALEALPLPWKQFSILGTMIAEYPKVVTRDRFYRDAYEALGHAEPTDETTLRTHIIRIRRAVGSLARIDCVWGVGYRLVLTGDEPQAVAA